jgi:formylglycine-generating enzyme required for sulfatase activity
MTLKILLLCLCWLLPLHAQERGIQPVSARLPSGQEIALYRHSYAVVVGVSDYDTWPDLPNAVRDAEEVAEALRKLGFEVRLVRDPDSQALEKVLEDLEFQTGAEQDRLLFYFAGHGETETLADGGELGYIVPRDAPLKAMDQRGFIRAAISMQRLEQSALRMRFKHALFVFDSCFSGSIFALQRAAPQNISEKVSLPVRQFITAGGKGETVPDQSVFKTTLLAALEGHGDLSGDGYITGTELGLYLQEQVVNYSRGAQHPQSGKLRNPALDKGDFVFVLEQGGQGAAQGYQDQTVQYDDQIERLKAEIEAEKRKKLEEETERKRLEAERLQRELEALRAKKEGVIEAQEPATPGNDIGYFGRPSISPGNRPKAGQTLTAQLPGGATMEFVWIEPGTFTMGSSGYVGAEPPKHKVRISRGFFLGKYEVTEAQWASVMGSEGKTRKPVVGITWLGAQEFIARLNREVNEILYRLPTEAEWEYACRAGTKTRWPFGDSDVLLNNYAWFAGNNNPPGPKEVGQKLPNPWGLFDMHGNAYEWCQDWWGSYLDRSMQTDPTGPETGLVRILRGGDFGNKSYATSSASRNFTPPRNGYFSYKGLNPTKVQDPPLYFF